MQWCFARHRAFLVFSCNTWAQYTPIVLPAEAPTTGRDRGAPRDAPTKVPIAPPTISPPTAGIPSVVAVY